MDDTRTGRGSVAVADMKARIAALKDQGEDVVDRLWERSRLAELGDGYRYEFAEQTPE
jgi:hypothetical protein